MEKTRTIEKNEEKQPKTPKQMTLFVLKIVGNVVFYGVILLMFIYSLMNINAKGKGGIPNLFGKGYATVATPSMDRNKNDKALYDAFPEYKNYKIKGFGTKDLVNLDMLTYSRKQKLKVGDVITFYDTTLSETVEKGYNTHRIVYAAYSYIDKNGITHNNAYDAGDGLKIYDVDDGKYVNIRPLEKSEYQKDSLKLLTFTCQGDKVLLTYLNVKNYKYNPIERTETANELDGSKYIVDTFTPDDKNVTAIVTSVNYGGGSTVKFVQNHWVGIFIIPIAIILVVEIILVVKNVLDLRREKNKKEDKLTHEQQMAELQSEKERMRAELLAELRSQGVITEEAAPAAVAVEEASEAPLEETKDEIATDTKEDAPVEVEAEEIKEEQPEEVKEEPVVEEAPQEETKSEENIEAVEENKGEEEPVVEETKEEAEASNLNISLEENEEEKPVKKTTAKKTSSKKKKDE